MDHLEEQLAQALRRESPPPGFESRVLARVRPPRVSIPTWLGAAAAALVIVSAGLGYRWHEGMDAKRQVLLAVRIAAGEVNRIQAQVKGASR